MKEQVFILKNQFGLDPHPAALFVREAGRFKSSVTVRHEGTGSESERLDIMGLMLLGADQGSRIKVRVIGPDEDAALAALAKLIESGFGCGTENFIEPKINPQPLGVPLDEMATALQAENCETHHEGDTLVVDHSNLVTRIEVVPPASRDSWKGPIRAVVRIRTFLPRRAQNLFSPKTNLVANSAASLGAVTVDGEAYVGSRVTLYEADEYWYVQDSFIQTAALVGAPSVLGAMRRLLGGDDPKDSKSVWNSEDLGDAETYLSRFVSCARGDTWLTTKFFFGGGSNDTGLGRKGPALWEMRTDRPHLELGGGLYTMLQMPYSIEDEFLLSKTVEQLNEWEMSQENNPPHLGAWCGGGRYGRNPSYVSFLPNAVYDAPVAGIVATWAFARAQWADSILCRAKGAGVGRMATA